MKSKQRLIPLCKWENYHPWPTERALRHYMFNRKSNGFEKVIHRVGRRILIKEDDFFEWANSSGEFTEEQHKDILPEDEVAGPKIMVADIETSPNIGYFWRPGTKVNIGYDNIVEERKIICISYTYLNSNTVHTLTWDSKQNDKHLLKKFSKLLNECDAVVFHNGDAFDLKWIKGRVLHHGLAPITNVVSIDTLKLSRANFNLNSHRLDYLANYIGSEGKISTNFQLWKDVLAGNKEALDKMVKYCEQDVLVLEKVFMEIVPYCDRLPVNLAVLFGNTRDECPMCGGNGIKYGFKTSRVGQYQKYQCKSCAHIWADSRMLKDEK